MVRGFWSAIDNSGSRIIVRDYNVGVQMMMSFEIRIIIVSSIKLDIYCVMAQMTEQILTSIESKGCVPGCTRGH